MIYGGLGTRLDDLMDRWLDLSVLPEFPEPGFLSEGAYARGSDEGTYLRVLNTYDLPMPFLFFFFATEVPVVV